MKRSKHWYKQHIEFCPVCCRDSKWSERVYGDKPKDPSERTSYTQVWCGFCAEYSG